MGAVLHGDACSFRVWAPNAGRIALTGSFNGWRTDDIWMWHEGNGYWSVDVRPVARDEHYRYVIDNCGGSEHNPGWKNIGRTDPYATDVEHSCGNGIIVDVEREKTESGLADDPFITPGFTDLICYQVHIGSFAGYNDHVPVGTDRCASFDQFSRKLDYIRGLGFNAIALLPEIENPGDVSMGYAPTNYFAPESAYGPPAELRRLVKTAHDKGLAVIFDVVYNHVSDRDNGLWEFDGMNLDGGIYFEGTSRTDFGPRPAHWKREIRDFFLDNARMLFEDYRADGLRFDAAHEIQWECLAHIVNGIRDNAYWLGKYLIAEWSGDRSHEWRSVLTDLGFDAVWAMNDPYRYRNTVDHLTYPDAGWRLDQLKSFIGWYGYPHAWNFVRYLLGSHDNVHDRKDGCDPSKRYLVEIAGGRGNWHARAKSRLGWALNTTIPGTPMMFMGSECNHCGYWRPAEDHNPLHRDHRFDWNLTRDWEGEQMLRLIGAANATRWANPALRSETLELKHEDRHNGVLAFKRWNQEGNVILVVVNIGESEWRHFDYGVRMNGDGGTWQEIFNSQAAEFGGYDIGNAGGSLTVSPDNRLYMCLPKWSVILFRKL